MRRPLRKIVGEFVEMRRYKDTSFAVEMEELECGHTVRRKQDVIGPTNATRRRCSKCARATETEKE